MMYLPDSFREDDPERLFAFIRSHSFATLVSSTTAEPEVTHLPLLLETSGAKGVIIGHMARANSHWRSLDGRQALAIFAGPHAYVSPRWCDERNLVPTWNYVVVHATGRFKLLESSEARMRVVSQYVQHYESGAEPAAWSIQRPDGKWIEQLLDAIVAFEIPIDQLTGKFKLSQNHPAERRAQVSAALAAEEDANSQAIAAWMRGLSSEG